MKKLAQLRRHWPLLVFVILPSLLAGLYYSLVAQDRYASRAAISVRDISGMSSSSSTSSGLGSLIGGSASAAFGDMLSLNAYIHSSQMLQRLEERLQLRQHYESPAVDFVYRLPKDAPAEKFLAYFVSRVDVHFDDLTGVLVVEAQAFDREMSRKLNQAILEESERFLNDYMHRIADERRRFAESEVESSKKRLQAAKKEVLEFQVKHRLLDPVLQASANSSLTASLQATLSGHETALNAALAYLSEDSYQVRNLRSQIAATKAQIAAESLRATASTGGAQLAALQIEYQALVSKAAFAEEALKTAQISYESARMDTMRKLKTLVVMEPPTLPGLAAYPKRLYDFLSFFVGCLMLFTIVKLLIATVLEHQD
ncbi:Wzz/FepE/Etk N-terminal domain-containing protein [Ideonella livida]|uniref:Capsular biosynthesis protein n=1 Tax=Ideonella livida TaxID=2707176 RepID=A0A7C9TI01_9BURK|nr:Wzz/FepE/Etk N-terminal domain-containing protein [Ideonella livida]NDY90901.1 capsular biosynthesis protein [Ideonella livida]